MTNEQLLQLLVDCEARHPVETFVVEGLHIWPLVRYEVMNNNLEIFTRAPAVSARPVQRLARRGREALRWLDAVIDDREHNDVSWPRRDLLFYSDGVSFVRLGESWVERYCDPIADAGAAEGLSSICLTPLHQYHRPRARPSVFVQPLLDSVSSLSAVSKRLRAPASHLALDEALRDLRSSQSGLRVPTVREVTFIARTVRAFATLFTAILEVVRPRVAFLPCYYGAERMALVVAARALGIPSVDVQHGVSGRGHWAFGQWKKLPPAGFELLPNWFWCWRSEDAADIEEWAERSGGAHRAVVGGNPIVDYFRGDGAASVVTGLLERAQRLTTPGSTTVLVTLNGLETAAQCRELAQVVAACQPATRFWLRLHPARRANEALLRTSLAEAGATNYEISQASELPLLALLRFADLHVTEGSSSLLEAIDLGVPSLLTSRDHLSTFGVVPADLVRVADSSERLISAIRLSGRRGAERVETRATSRSGAALRLILQSTVGSGSFARD